MGTVTTIDCHYFDRPLTAAAYLLTVDDEVAFVDTNTAPAVPRLLQALKESGKTPDHVRYVIITHVHLDHAGGAADLLAACPNATLLAHPRAANHVIDPSRLLASTREVYGAATFERVYGHIAPIEAARVQTIADNGTMPLGRRTLHFLHTRGHANHHFCIYEPDDAIMFTGDAFGLCYPVLQDAGTFALPSTTPTDFDAIEAKRAVQRIVATGVQTAYLAHFGPVQDIHGVADQLLTQLDGHGAVVEDALAGALDGVELQAFCEQRLHTLYAPQLTTGKRQAALKAPDGQLVMDLTLNAQGLATAVARARRKKQHPQSSSLR